MDMAGLVTTACRGFIDLETIHSFGMIAEI